MVNSTSFFGSRVTFSHFETRRLTVNKRLEAQPDDSCRIFANYLKKVATGVAVDDNGCEWLPEEFQENSLNALIEHVFPQVALSDPLARSDRLRRSALLCPTNAQTFRINDLLMVLIEPFMDLTFCLVPGKDPRTDEGVCFH